MLRANRLLLPQSLKWKFIKMLYEDTPLGRDALATLISQPFVTQGLHKTVQEMTRGCAVCSKNNPQGHLPLPPLLMQRQGHLPWWGGLANRFHSGAPKARFKFSLVFADTFLGCVETFPTRTEKATEMAKYLPKEISPRFLLPRSLQATVGPLTARTTQQRAWALGIDRHRHSSYRPQSLGEGEKANHTLGRTLAKLLQGTAESWEAMLPAGLMGMTAAPEGKLRASPSDSPVAGPFSDLTPRR